jgi:hypothetical protein
MPTNTVVIAILRAILLLFMEANLMAEFLTENIAN